MSDEMSASHLNIVCVSCILVAFSASLVAARSQGPAPSSAADTRARSWQALTSRVSRQKYLTHSLGVEAIMRSMASKQDNPDEWGLAGLLHDIDIDTTENDPARHGVAGAQTLRELGLSEAVVHAVSAHDDHAGVARTNRMDHALFCADQTYWLVLSVAPGFPSAEFNGASPSQLWEHAQASTTKPERIGEISGECEKSGFTMPMMFETAHRALSGLPLPRS
jgi:putative nucleotidyltransferase with HDIG domain